MMLDGDPLRWSQKLRGVQVWVPLWPIQPSAIDVPFLFHFASNRMQPSSDAIPGRFPRESERLCALKGLQGLGCCGCCHDGESVFRWHSAVCE